MQVSSFNYLAYWHPSVNKWRRGNSSSQSEQRDGFGKNQEGKGKLFVVTVDREREQDMSVIVGGMQLETSNKQIMEGLKLYAKDFVFIISVAIGQQPLEHS